MSHRLTKLSRIFLPHEHSFSAVVVIGIVVVVYDLSLFGIVISDAIHIQRNIFFALAFRPRRFHGQRH